MNSQPIQQAESCSYNNDSPVRTVDGETLATCKPPFSPAAQTRFDHQEFHSPQRRYSCNEIIKSPEVESQIFLFQHCRESEQFHDFMAKSSSYNPEAHIKFLHQIVKFLIRDYTQKRDSYLYALDYCKVYVRANNIYCIVPPSQPMTCMDSDHFSMIKTSNIHFILASIERILPDVENVSQLQKQFLEDAISYWCSNKIISDNKYLKVLNEINEIFES